MHARTYAHARTLGRHEEGFLAVEELYLPHAGPPGDFCTALSTGLEYEAGTLAQAAVPLLVDVQVDGRLLVPVGVGRVAPLELRATVAGEPVERAAGLLAGLTAALTGVRGIRGM